MYSVSSQKIQWGWASAIWQLDSLFDTARVVYGAGSIKRSGVCPSACLSVSQSVPSVERSSGVRRVCCWVPYAQKISIDSAGHPAAAAPQPGPQHGAQQQMRAINVTLTAELTRLNTDGLVSILLQFQQYSLLVCNLCPDGKMRGIIYGHIGQTGLGWIDGQKSPVFRRGKSGSPNWDGWPSLGGLTTSCQWPHRSTEPLTYSGMQNEYRPKGRKLYGREVGPTQR